MKTPPWPKKVKVSRRKYLFAVSLDYVWFGSQNFSCRLRTDKIREKKNLGTSTTPKPFYSHLSTNRDGHQSSCHRKGKIVPGTPYKIWNHTIFEIARVIIWRARHAAFLACVKKQKFCLLSDLGNTYSPPSGYKYQTTFAQQFLAGLLISVQMK